MHLPPAHVILTPSLAILPLHNALSSLSPYLPQSLHMFRQLLNSTSATALFKRSFAARPRTSQPRSTPTANSQPQPKKRSNDVNKGAGVTGARVKVNPNRYANASFDFKDTKQKPEPVAAPVATDPDTPKGMQDDMSGLFSKSRLNHIFNAEHPGFSYFNGLETGGVVYLAGTRRMISSDGAFNEVNTCFNVRSVDREQRHILDRIISIDYQTNMPFEQENITYIGEDLTRGHAMDRNQETGEVRSRTFIKLRGDPWNWHSALAVTRLEVDEKEKPEQADTMTITRVRFNDDGMVLEKVIRQNGETLFTVIDDMKVVTSKQFQDKTEKLFEEYSERLAQALQRAAEEFGDEEAERLAQKAGVDMDDIKKKQ